MISGTLYAHELCGFSFGQRLLGRIRKAVDFLYDQAIYWHLED